MADTVVGSSGAIVATGVDYEVRFITERGNNKVRYQRLVATNTGVHPWRLYNEDGKLLASGDMSSTGHHTIGYRARNVGERAVLAVLDHISVERIGRVRRW